MITINISQARTPISKQLKLCDLALNGCHNAVVKQKLLTDKQSVHITELRNLIDIQDKTIDDLSKDLQPKPYNLTPWIITLSIFTGGYLGYTLRAKMEQ